MELHRYPLSNGQKAAAISNGKVAETFRPELTFWKMGQMCKTTGEIQCKLMQIDVITQTKPCPQMQKGRSELAGAKARGSAVSRRQDSRTD